MIGLSMLEVSSVRPVLEETLTGLRQVFDDGPANDGLSFLEMVGFALSRRCR